MVKKYEPYHKWYPYEEDPSLEMREARDGQYVSLETYHNETKRQAAQIARQKEYIAELENKIKEAQALFDFRLKSQPKNKGKKPSNQ